ncbi:oxygen-sensing adenylate cyclase [Leishmania guyanensis]
MKLFGQQLYDEMLTENSCPHVHLYGVNREEQSKSLPLMVGAAVHLYEEPQVTVDRFIKASLWHRSHGVNEEVFVEMRNVFFKAVPKFVDTDVFRASGEEWQKSWKLALHLQMHRSESLEDERYGGVYGE